LGESSLDAALGLALRDRTSLARLRTSAIDEIRLRNLEAGRNVRDVSFYRPLMIPDPTRAAGERTLNPWIGWITYLRPDLASRAKYPADVEVETLNDGGALVTLCEEQFEETDVEGMARLRARGRAASDSKLSDLHIRWRRSASLRRATVLR
jgi:hypothetical protein